MMKRVTMTCVMALLLALGQNASFAQTTIAVDGAVSDWTEDMRLDVPPNTPIITWQDGADGRDNSPADPEDLEFMVDLNFAGLYVTDDEENLYVRIDMNPLADVRNVWTDTEMYPANQRVELFLSTDPDLFLDFADTTGMSWGWYFSGVDFIVPLYPIDTDYEDTTGYQVAVAEHTQETNEWAFVSPHPEGGARIAWNDDYNQVEVAIPKAVVLQPAHMPWFEGSEYVAIILSSAAHNTRSTPEENPWWEQRIANNLDVLGFVYTYEAEFTGVGSERVPELANGFVLEQNYPNPFNPGTTIRFTMKEAADVRVEVLDVLGRHRATILEAGLAPGTHAVEFDGSGFESGIYVYRVTAGGVITMRTMMFIK